MKNKFLFFLLHKKKNLILHLRSSSTLNTFVNLIFSQIVRNCGRLNHARSGSSGTTKRVVRKPNKFVSVDWNNSIFCSSGVRALFIANIHSWKSPGPIKCWFQPWIYKYIYIKDRMQDSNILKRITTIILTGILL